MSVFFKPSFCCGLYLSQKIQTGESCKEVPAGVWVKGDGACRSMVLEVEYMALRDV